LDPNGENDFLGAEANAVADDVFPLLIDVLLAATRDASMAGISGSGAAGMGFIEGESFAVGTGSWEDGLPGEYNESLPAATGFRPNGENDFLPGPGIVSKVGVASG
jgi:hypothetical protein